MNSTSTGHKKQGLPRTPLLCPIFAMIILTIFVVGLCACNDNSTSRLPYGKEAVINKDALMDKIRGGWAGQSIGCTYGGPTEFRYKGSIIHDYQKIEWHDDIMPWWFDNKPWLYDDVYMDIGFMNVIESHGLDAPAATFALAFANAEYRLWHANQTARYNILRGVMPPASGHWKSNPHADDIDFQIEADFIGIMSPGMPNAASEFSDKIGHIMCHGDGWYGGVFVAAMYSLAFVTDDVRTIASEALRTIPEQSKFYRCISDVLAWHKQYPGDWKQCWFEVEKKYAEDRGCPAGVFKDLNIDATINAAYVVIGLLYGNGDFNKTMEIATRCGQDSDCNPATAAGIAGVMLGYGKIPDVWKPAYEKVERRDFPYVNVSLAKTCGMSFRHALRMAGRNGGRADDKNLYVRLQKPVPVRLEECFEGLEPSKSMTISRDFLSSPFEVEFAGRGVVVDGSVRTLAGAGDAGAGSYVAWLEAYIDGQRVEKFDMPADIIKRKYGIFHKYDLPTGKHTLVIKWVNPDKNHRINVKDVLVYE
jgi:hypothetical protein